MIAKKTRCWLLHSTRRVRKVHILTTCSFLVSGETRVKMCVKMLGLHFAWSFFVVRSSANKCSTLQLFINYKSSILMNNAVRQSPLTSALWLLCRLKRLRISNSRYKLETSRSFLDCYLTLTLLPLTKLVF
jgi:hypothetical protein